MINTKNMKKNYISPLMEQIIIEEESLICGSPDPYSLKVSKTEKAGGSTGDDLARERLGIDEIEDLDFGNLW